MGILILTRTIPNKEMHLPTIQYKTTCIIIIPYIVFYYIEVITQFGCFTENVMTWEIIT